MPERAIHHRRIVEDERFLGGGRAVGVENFHLCLDQSRGQIARIRDRRRAAHELRLASVKARDAPQTPQHVAQMAAEHAAIRVQLIDHDVAQILEQARPAGVVRQDAGVQHVGIGQHQMALFANGFSRVARRVAVVREHAEAIVQPLVDVVQLGELVLRQRLGGKEIERARVGISKNRVQDRQVVAERLARRGRRDDDHILSRVHRFRGRQPGGCKARRTPLAAYAATRSACIQDREVRPLRVPVRESGAPP